VRQVRTSKLPWIVAGVSIAAVIVVLMLPALRGTSPSLVGNGPTAAAPFAGEGSMGTPPPLTGTPREQADRLFDRIMREREAGNLERAAGFLPMAIAAYNQAGELDADGLYHLSMLQSAAGDLPAARATAERILVAAPDHLLGLAAAADAAADAGDSATARKHWSHFLEVFDVESGKPLQEYLDHGRILPEYRATARTFVGS
jgi:tetratricopeptide (TPR) repeat protein